MSQCLRCGNCCTRFGVCITPFDIKRISKTTGLAPTDIADFILEPRKRERREPAILIDGKKCLLVLKRDIDDVCLFYSKMGCKTYLSRPMLCRTYPFTLKNKKLVNMNSRACNSCWYPLYNDEKQYFKDILRYSREVEKYRKIAEDWNKKGGTFKDFLIFVCNYKLVKK